MKKISKPVTVGITVFAVCFAMLLTYVALRGENDKIDNLLANFFKQVRDQRYVELHNDPNILAHKKVFPAGEDFAANCFLFELALLEHFKLTASPQYKVVFEKSHFWIPFFRDESVKIGIALRHVGEGGPLSLLAQRDDEVFLHGLISVARKKGMWKISGINLQDTPLAATFSKLRAELKLDSYVTRRGDKFIISPMEIDSERISAMEKRKLSFILNNIGRLLAQSQAGMAF